MIKTEKMDKLIDELQLISGKLYTLGSESFNELKKLKDLKIEFNKILKEEKIKAENELLDIHYMVIEARRLYGRLDALTDGKKQMESADYKFGMLETAETLLEDLENFYYKKRG